MARYVDVTYRDKHARLLFTMSAMLDIEETYDAPINEVFIGTKREVFERECYAISVMSYEGKIAYNNEFDGLTLSELNTAQPYEINELVDAMFEAITIGFKREIEPEIIDEGLMELKKKKSDKDKNEQS